MYGFKKVIFGWLMGFWLLVGCFIGSHLVDGLVSEGFDVVVLDDLSKARERVPLIPNLKELVWLIE